MLTFIYFPQETLPKTSRVDRGRGSLLYWQGGLSCWPRISPWSDLRPLNTLSHRLACPDDATRLQVALLLRYRSSLVMSCAGSSLCPHLKHNLLAMYIGLVPRRRRLEEPFMQEYRLTYYHDQLYIKCGYLPSLQYVIRSHIPR